MVALICFQGDISIVSSLNECEGTKRATVPYRTAERPPAMQTGHPSDLRYRDLDGDPTSFTQLFRIGGSILNRRRKNCSKLLKLAG